MVGVSFGVHNQLDFVSIRYEATFFSMTLALSSYLAASLLSISGVLLPLWKHSPSKVS